VGDWIREDQSRKSQYGMMLIRLLEEQQFCLVWLNCRPDQCSHSLQTVYWAQRSFSTSPHSSAQAKRKPLSTYMPKEELFHPVILASRGDM
jgi:hypothetical protein